MCARSGAVHTSESQWARRDSQRFTRGSSGLRAANLEMPSRTPSVCEHRAARTYVGGAVIRLMSEPAGAANRPRRCGGQAEHASPGRRSLVATQWGGDRSAHGRPAPNEGFGPAMGLVHVPATCQCLSCPRDRRRNERARPQHFEVHDRPVGPVRAGW